MCVRGRGAVGLGTKLNEKIQTEVLKRVPLACGRGGCASYSTHIE